MSGGSIPCASFATLAPSSANATAPRQLKEGTPVVVRRVPRSPIAVVPLVPTVPVCGRARLRLHHRCPCYFLLIFVAATAYAPACLFGETAAPGKKRVLQKSRVMINVTSHFCYCVLFEMKPQRHCRKGEKEENKERGK